MNSFVGFLPVLVRYLRPTSPLCPGQGRCDGRSPGFVVSGSEKQITLWGLEKDAVWESRPFPGSVVSPPPSSGSGLLHGSHGGSQINSLLPGFL